MAARAVAVDEVNLTASAETRQLLKHNEVDGDTGALRRAECDFDADSSRAAAVMQQRWSTLFIAAMPDIFCLRFCIAASSIIRGSRNESGSIIASFFDVGNRHRLNNGVFSEAK
jgi:hypothetical protein